MSSIICWNCEQPFNPDASRWLCPHCKAKSSCCEGEPCPLPTTQATPAAR